MYQALFTPYNVNVEPVAILLADWLILIVLIAEVERHRLTSATVFPAALPPLTNTVLYVVVLE